MRIIVIGASGTLGKAAVNALQQNHEIIQASRNGEVQVDLGNPDSIKAMYNCVTGIDAVVCAAGNAKFGSLDAFTGADFDFSFGNKLMGQINLVRFGREHLNEAGVFTLTTGMLAHMPNATTVMLTYDQSGSRGFRGSRSA